MDKMGHATLELDVDQYIQSKSQILRLKSHLPPEAVKSLAREVIRRLSDHRVEITAGTPPCDDQIELLCLALLSADDQAGIRFVEQVRVEGVSIDAVYLNYLAGAARMLGTWWENDTVEFTQVALGTSRMYAIMRALRHVLIDQDMVPKKSAVFASVPGETHTLGVRMAADLFTSEGWDVALKIDMEHDQLLHEIDRTKAAIIGISAGGDHAIQALSKLVVALRVSNPHAAIFISGNVLNEAKEKVELIGFEGMADDVDCARSLMAKLWDARVKRRSTPQ